MLHRRVHRSRRRITRRGISVVEFLVASSLILVVLVGAGSTLATSERSLARSIARDAAAVSAANLLEQAALFGCQTQSDPTEALELAATCASLRTLATTGRSPTGGPSVLGGAGDAVFEVLAPTGCTPNSPGCTRFVVTSTSRWLRLGQGSGACVSTISDASQPMLLERTVRLRWTVSSQSEPITAEYVTVSARPDAALFTDADRRGVLVSAPAGSAVTLVDGNDNKMVRVAAPCSGGDATGEAWFPFLPAGGTYTVATLDASVTESPEAFAGALAAAATGTEVRLSECAPAAGQSDGASSCLARIAGQ